MKRPRLRKMPTEAQRTADEALRGKLVDIDTLKRLIGQQPEVKVDAVETDFNADMAKYGATIPPEKKNYRQSLEFFKSTYDAANVERVTLKEELDKLKLHIAAYEMGKEEEVKKHKEAEQKAVADSGLCPIAVQRRLGREGSRKTRTRRQEQGNLGRSCRAERD